MCDVNVFSLSFIVYRLHRKSYVYARRITPPLKLYRRHRQMRGQADRFILKPFFNELNLPVLTNNHIFIFWFCFVMYCILIFYIYLLKFTLICVSS